MHKLTFHLDNVSRNLCKRLSKRIGALSKKPKSLQAYRLLLARYTLSGSPITNGREKNIPLIQLGADGHIDRMVAAVAIRNTAAIKR